MFIFLGKAFVGSFYLQESHLRQSLQSYRPDEAIAKALLQAADSFGLSTEEIEKRFIEPFTQLNESQLSDWLYVMNEMSFAGKLQCPLEFDARRRVDDSIAPFIWLIAQVLDLHLEGFSEGMQQAAHVYPEFQNYLTIQPFHQCLYCGRLNTDLRGREIKKFCHLPNCPTRSSGEADSNPANPAAHLDGCCFRAWQKRKRHFKQRIMRIHNGRGYKYGDLSPGQRETLIKDEFLRFCNQLLTDNISRIQARIRTVHDYEGKPRPEHLFDYAERIKT